MSTSSTARSPFTFALNRSGNIVGEWLPQTARSCTSSTAAPELLRELCHGPVLVQARHRGEALGRDVGRVAQRDQRVRVGGVAHHEHAHPVRRPGVQGLALRLEYLAVGLEQVGPLHALGARPRAHQQRHVHAVERLARVVVDLGRRRAAGMRSPAAPGRCPRRPSPRRGSRAGAGAIPSSGPSIWPLAIRNSRA